MALHHMQICSTIDVPGKQHGPTQMTEQDLLLKPLMIFLEESKFMIATVRNATRDSF